MARTAGAVSVAFKGSDKNFSREARKVMTRLERMKQQSKRIAASMKRNWKSTTYMVTAFVAGLGLALKKMTDYSSNLVEMSRTTGMAVKQLEAMRSLFKGDGIGVEKTDKAFAALNNRVGQAAMGYGQAKRALENMGISLKDATGKTKTTDKIFKEVAEKIGNMGSASEATALLFDLMGNDAKWITPIIQKYGKNIGKAAEQANRFRTVSEEQHKQNKDLGQEFTNLGDNMVDMVTRGLSPMSPAIEGAIKSLNSLIQKMKTGFASVGRVVAKLLGWVGDLFGEQWRSNAEQLAKNLARIAELEQQIKTGNVPEIAGYKDFETPKNEIAQLRADNKRIKAEDAARREAGTPVFGVDGVDAGGGGSGGGAASIVDKFGSGTGAPFPLSFHDSYMLTRGRSAHDEAKVYSRRRLERQKRLRLAAVTESQRRKFILGDLASMSSLYDLQLTDLKYGYRGGGLGSGRHSSIDDMVDPAGYLAPASIGTNFGLGRMSAGQSSGAIGGLGWQGARGSGRDTSDEELAIYRIARGVRTLQANVESLGSTFEQRSAGAKAWWKGQMAVIKETNDEAEKLKQTMIDLWEASLAEADRGAAARAAGARSFWTTGMLADANPIEDQLERMDDMIAVTDRVRGAFDRMGHAIIDNFDNAGDALRAFGKELLGIFIQRQVLNPVANMLFGGAGTSGGGIFGNLLGGLFGGGFSGGAGIPTLADGGLAGRGMALVGERGPELVDFSQPGRVYNNEQLSAAMRGNGGGAPTINYYINSTDGPGVRAALAEATPQIASATMSQVATESQRPGRFRSAVRGRGV